MAIQFTEPSKVVKIIYRSLEIDVQNKSIRVYLIDENSEDFSFTTKESQWNAALSLLFDNLTDAAELKDRIENYLIANEITDGTKVPD